MRPRGVPVFRGATDLLTDLLAWRENADSRKHSLLYLDGLAEATRRGKGAERVDHRDRGRPRRRRLGQSDVRLRVVGPGHTDARRPFLPVFYDASGNGQYIHVWFDEPEYGKPHDFGCPADDNGADIGLTRPQFTSTETLTPALQACGCGSGNTASCC